MAHKPHAGQKGTGPPANGCHTPPITRVLHALGDSVIKSGTGWKALCPAHDDTSPSLGIAEGDDGKVLIHCRVGCDYAEVVEALGLKQSDLFPPAGDLPKPAKSKPAAKSTGKAFPTAAAAVRDLEVRNGKRAGQWTYRDAAGQPVMVVVRFNRADGSKDFRPIHRTAAGWQIGALPKPRPLYLLPDLAAAEVVLWVEGEKAADAARKLGFVVTTHSGGSQAAGQTDYAPLAGKTVVVLPDNDAPGRKCVEQVARILSRLSAVPKVKVVELPGLPPKGDVADWASARPEKDPAELRAELEAIIEAAPYQSLKPPTPTPPPDLEGCTAEPPDGDRPDNPHRLAAGFLAGRTANPVRYYRGGFVVYVGGAYGEVSDDEVRGWVTAWVRAEFVRLHPGEVAAWETGGRRGPRPSVRPVTTRVVADVLNAVRSLALLASSVTAPAWVDGATGPDPKNIIVLRNGLFDIRDEKRHDPDPRFFTFNALAFDYEKEPPRPVEWERFLVKLWGNDDEPKAADTESLNAIQEWLGYLLVSDTSQQKMLWIIGPKRGGKGTIARVTRALVGERNYTGPKLRSLTGEFGLAPLLDKGVAVVADARLGKWDDTAAIVECLLSITGEDTQSVNRKHRPHVDAKLPTRFVLLSNVLPHLPDDGEALSGRVILLRLTRTFFGKEDTALTDRLLRELPGIFAWAVEGLKRLRERGRFCQPKSGKELLDDLEELSSPVGAFVRDRCVTSEPESHATVGELFAEWKRWCESHGRDHPGTEQSFGRHLRAAVPTLRDFRPNDGGERQRGYKGIRLRRAGEVDAET